MKRILGGLMLALLFCAQARGDWQEPKDKKISEDQLNIYVATATEWLDEMRQIRASVSTAQTDEGKLAAIGDLDKKERECLDRHHISKAEFEWVSGRVLEAYNLATAVNEIFGKIEAELREQEKSNSDKLEAARQQLATYQTAGDAAGISKTQETIRDCEGLNADLTLARLRIEKSKEDMNKDIPEENIALVRKHQAEIKRVVDRLSGDGPATEPETNP